MSQNKINQTLAKPCGITAGVLGLIQGLTWTVLTILCICCHEEAIGVDIKPDGTSTLTYIDIYNIFLKPNTKTDTNIIVTPNVFFIFMIVLMVFSSLWTIVSGVVLWAMIHNKWNLTKHIFGSWSILTALISIEDIVLMSLLAADLRYEDQTNKLATTNTLMAYGIVMSMAVRGYILWIANVILVGFTAKFAIDASSESGDSSREIINAYDTSSIDNPPWMQQSNNKNPLAKPVSENIYDTGFDNPGFERSQSFFPLNVAENNRTSSNNFQEDYIPNNTAYPTGNRNNVNDNFYFDNGPVYANSNNINRSPDRSMERVAKIGKQGRRSPPIPVPAPNVPHIPPPDYTPPGTPTGLKSVLRQKSNYY